MIGNWQCFDCDIDTQKIMLYIQNPVNQRAKLPPYLDGKVSLQLLILGTQIYSDQIHSLNKRLKALDTITAAISVVSIVLIFLEVKYPNPLFLRTRYFGTTATQAMAQTQVYEH